VSLRYALWRFHACLCSSSNRQLKKVRCCRGVAEGIGGGGPAGSTALLFAEMHLLDLDHVGFESWSPMLYCSQWSDC